ncbi:MAG: protein kinase [Candidatus Hydrogenedens sp.]|nr:protein kinase [Candidatus Hydrogenedens sp.]
MSLEQTPPKRYQFGAYEILDTVGHGGMGVVYRAYDRNLGRAVALKILRDELRGEAKVAARFQREAEACGRLDHPNIVHVYSVGMVENIPFIAMEFVEGETLACRMRREGLIDWREALRIGAQVADALGAAHEAQIIHRDVKPGNILLDLEGRARVTDFGIAKILNASTQLTTDGTRLGTPQYMCPERCQNQKVTPASDIYSLGVVLFQAITCRLPYEARSNVELLNQISAGEPKRLRDLLPDIPDSVDRLLAYMLEKSPDKRPSSARVLSEAIERVLSGGTLDEHAEALAQRLDQYRRSLPEASPVTPDPDTPTRALGSHRKVARKVSRRWFSLPRSARLALAFAFVLSAAAGIAVSVASLTEQAAPLLGPLSAESVVARWNEPVDLLAFRSEAPGITLASLALPDFEVADLSLRGTSGGVALLRGKAGSARAGHYAVAGWGPENAAQLLVPPFLGTKSAGLRLLDDAEGESVALAGAAGVRRFYSDGWRAGAPAPGEKLWSAAAGPITQPFFNAEGNWIRIGAYNTGGYHDWQLGVIEASGLRRTDELTPPGPPIAAVAARGGTDVVAYLRELPSRGEASVELRALSGTREISLAEGALELASGAVSPSGRVAFGRTDGTEPGVFSCEPGDHAEAALVSTGAWPQWISAETLLIHDTDRLGRVQLFLVPLAQPLSRVQLTHFDSGVSATGAVLQAESGRAAVALPGGRSVALIDLEQASAV